MPGPGSYGNKRKDAIKKAIARRPTFARPQRHRKAKPLRYR